MLDVQTLNRGELLIMSDKQLSELMCLQDVAINLLATGYSMEEAAEVLGVTVVAISNWQRRNPAFRPIVKSLREQVEQRQQQRKRRR
jgi:hypothetical protein